METTTISLTDLISLTQGLANTNLEYLGICVTIIIFFGGFFYIFNFKPLQKSIENQDSELKSLKKEVGAKLDLTRNEFKELSIKQEERQSEGLAEMKSIINKLQNESSEKLNIAEQKILEFTGVAEKELSKLRNQYQAIELERLWDKHYMWEGREVPANTLTTLIEYMEKAILYKKMYITDLWLDEVNEALEKIKNPRIQGKDEIRTRLTKILTEITTNDQVKEKIKESMKRVLS